MGRKTVWDLIVGDYKRKCRKGVSVEVLSEHLKILIESDRLARDARKIWDGYTTDHVGLTDKLHRLFATPTAGTEG